MHHLLNMLFTTLIIAAILIFIYFLQDKWLKHRERSWALVLKQDNNKALATYRITAYERIVIMLERITPTSLVMRQSAGARTAALLQLELIKSIREEFEHNVSLQVYVSPETWEKVKSAKEETTELVKMAYTRVRPENSGIELSHEIFKLEAATGNAAIRDAIAAVKTEMKRYF
jgi:hypothetical protein